MEFLPKPKEGRFANALTKLTKHEIEGLTRSD